MRISNPPATVTPPTMVMATVAFSTTSRTDSRTALTSITVTLGNARTRSRCTSPSASGESLSCRNPTTVYGACSMTTPGRNTKIKPPFCVSSHATFRTLVTRASITRPAMSNLRRSPRPMLYSSRMRSSIETSRGAAGSSARPVQKVPSISRSLSARASRNVSPYSRPSSPSRRTSSAVSSVTRSPSTPTTRPRKSGSSDGAARWKGSTSVRTAST